MGVRRRACLNACECVRTCAYARVCGSVCVCEVDTCALGRQRVAGVPGAMGAMAAFSLYTGTLDLQPTDTVLGMDPMVGLGVAGLGCGVAGFFAASVLSGVAWRLARPQLAAQLELRQRQYHAHVSRMRAPAETLPISGGGGGVVTPDFYGEKVGSVADYRTWLRKQRAQCRAAAGTLRPPPRTLNRTCADRGRLGRARGPTVAPPKF
jgi:hypothetical protein